MGAFVLGILVGWFIEWLFFSYWIKGRSTGNFADCSGLKSELTAKNKEITDLKAELINAKSSEKTSVDLVKDSAVKVSSASNSKAENKKSIKPSSSTKKQSNTIKKATTKKVVNHQTGSRKQSALKKSTSSKKGKVKVASNNSSAKKAIKPKGDDFTKLSGIGPSISATLNDLGISSFQKLSEMDGDMLRDMLAESGVRMNNNKEAIDTWSEQAALAAKGDFEALKKFQDALKS